MWVIALPTYRKSTPLHEFRQCHMDSLIAGRRTTSSQILALSSSLPTLPIATLPALLAGIGFTMTEALPSISWRPALPPPPEAAHLVLTASLTLPTLPAPPPEAAHLDLQASLTLPTLPATLPKSATPNQGLPTSTSSEPPQRSSPTSAPLMPHGQPCLQHPHSKCRRDNLITGMQKTSSPASPPLMPYGWPFRQHRHSHRLRDKIIAGIQKTSSPTSAPSMPYGRPCCQHLHRQMSSTHGTTPDGLYHRWRQRLGPHHRHERLQPYHFVHRAFLTTHAKLATVSVGECVNTIAFSLIAGTSAFSLITSYTGPFLRRLPRSQPSWWGNVLIPGSFPFNLSPVSMGPPAHYK